MSSHRNKAPPTNTGLEGGGTYDDHLYQQRISMVNAGNEGHFQNNENEFEQETFEN